MGRGDVALENDEMEGRRGLGKGSTQNERIQEVLAGFEHEGDIVLAGWAGRGWQELRRGKEGTKKRQLRSGDGGGSTSQLCRAVLEGPGSSRKGRQLLWSTQAGRGSWHAQRTR